MFCFCFCLCLTQAKKDYHHLIVRSVTRWIKLNPCESIKILSTKLERHCLSKVLNWRHFSVNKSGSIPKIEQAMDDIATVQENGPLNYLLSWKGFEGNIVR